MQMEFSPFNNVVKRCVQGIDMEEKANPEEALKLFLRSWNEATNDFEKFLAAHFIARHQKTFSDRLKWLETTLHYALGTKDTGVNSALFSIYLNIAQCHENLGDRDQAKNYYGLATSINSAPSDKGPFYHGTKVDLKLGDLLTPGGNSNYKSELKMNHIYFTALTNGAGLSAALAKGDGPERVYIVEPTSSFENDPNVTDKKFPGNLSRSYRSTAPLKIVGELTDWVKQEPQAFQKWRERLAKSKGEIIN